MRRSSVLAFLVALAVALPAAPVTAAVIQILGDFETGTLDGWQQVQWSLGGNCGWQASSSPDEGWLSGYAVREPSGMYQAVGDHELYYSTTVLYRDFTVPANADSLKLRLWYRSSEPGFMSDMPTLQPGGQGQGMRIDLMSPAQPVLGMAGIVATPFATSYPGNSADWLDPVTVRMSVVALRGQTLRLRIATMANTGYMVTGIDDVRLEGSLYAEVATSLPQLRDGAADWGDFDNDGDLDLALMGHDGVARVASIWRNDAGTFHKLLDLPEGLSGGDLKWVDLDRDGDLDLVAAGDNGAAGTLRSGRNLGGGVFAWTSYSPGWRRTNLALADYDGDGDFDVAGAGYLPGPAAAPVLWRNTGAGTLAAVSVPGVIAVDSACVRWERREFPGLATFGEYAAYGPTYTSAYFRNDGPGDSLALSGYGYPDLIDAAYETADADGDGIEEEYSGGQNYAAYPSYKVSSVLHLSNPAIPVPHDIPPLFGPAARWIDDDADGDLDLIVSGMGDAGRHTQFHRWSGGVLALASEAFPQVARGAVAPGDFDGDGDPDLLILGDAVSGPVTRLFRNLSQIPNAGPAAPPTSAATFTANALTLHCQPAADDHTPGSGLTWNFRAGLVPGQADLVTPDAGLASGLRRVAREGNAANRRTYSIHWRELAGVHTPVYFAAQAIDGARRGGAWSPEAIVHIGGHILSVADVPGDQGGAVRVRLAAGLFDAAAPSPAPVTGYTLWQRIDDDALQASVARAWTTTATPIASPATEGDGAPFATLALDGRTFVSAAAAAAAGFPAGSWEAVTSLSPMQQAEYVVRGATLADSGATGAHWSVYCVTTHSSKPTTWWVSSADSGKSVDNIAPGVPQGLAAHYHTGGGNALAWQPSADADFQYFRVYRGDTPGFALSPATLAEATASTAWSDPAHDAPGVYYQVTAVDHNGNESLAASPGTSTEVAGSPGPAFALGAPSPSPFGSSTQLSFALPLASAVTLEVYDASGRRVRTLARGAFAAGVHELAWDGRGEDGSPVAAGVLFVRLRAGGQEAVRRVVALGGAR
jgi:hypothetical protein